MQHRFLAATAMVAAILSPSIAAAQLGLLKGSSTTDKPTSLEELTKATREADAAIAEAKVEDLFENVTDDRVPAVRHKLSGMRCAWDPGTKPSFQVFEGSPRGDDVGCSMNTVGATFSLFATRYPEKPTAKDVVQSSLDSIQKQFTNVKNYEGQAVNIQRDGDDLPKTVVARLTAELKGQTFFTRSAAVQVGDWIIAQRATGPTEKATVIDLMAGLSLMRVVVEMVESDKPGPKPTTATTTP